MGSILDRSTGDHKPGGGEPLVTVLIPVRDGVDLLQATLDSLRAVQTPDLQVLWVDDGSTDATPSLLAAEARRDPRTSVLTLKPSGIMAALNAGLARITTPWVARLDADDLVEPHRFDRQMQMATSDDLTVVGSQVRCFPRATLTRGMRRYEGWINGLCSHEAMALERFVESPVVHPSVLMQTEAVKAVGGYREMGWPEDYDLWLRLMRAGARFGKVAEPLTWWRDHPRRLTRTAAHCKAEAIFACKAHHLMIDVLKRGDRPFAMAGTGSVAKAQARALIAEGATLAGWLDINPRRIGQQMQGAPVRALDAVHSVWPDDVVMLGAVGRAGGRAELSGTLIARGWRPGEDFWSVA